MNKANHLLSSKSCFTALLLLLVLAFACAEEPAKKAEEQPEMHVEDKVMPETEESDEPEQPEEPEKTTPVEMSEPKTAEPVKKAPQKKVVAEPASGGMLPLDLKLPKPMFIGTPQNFRVDKLEKPLGKPRPPFLVPAGTKNVASGRPVASTDDAPIIGEISMITDGDKEAADGSYVELGPFLQHITIDLGARHDIYAILLWHFHKQARVYYDVVLQAADNPDFSENVQTLFNNDHDESAGIGAGKDLHYVETSEGRLIDAKGVQARYVRLYSNGNTNNDLNHYIEVEVYGKPAM